MRTARKTMWAQAKRRGRYGIVLAFLLGLVAVVGLAAHAQAIADWARLRGYEPPAAISELARQTTMTPAAEHLFYLNHPAIADKQAFRRDCPSYEATIVVGCYRPGERGIYVLKVDDPRLRGIEQVTAAHETLHAVYDRLDSGERQRIDGWLEDFAAHQLRDQRIKQTLQSYKTTEPGQQDNEMFAIFGTEVAGLPADLQRVYGRYFSNRSAVVAFAADYQAAFTSRQAQIAQDDSRLNDLDKQIKADTSSLQRQNAELARRGQQLDSLRQSGDISSYNAGVDSFNQQVDDYNNLLTRTKALIAQYNQLVAERNAIAAQAVELRQAIDSSSLPARQ